ncbi:uncharacterized protein LOC133144251 [Syngnathus typhle]|uniref:uncharacterized protein LOC133144251 n=1 Tax=Syngnathus typhle TaxID=161592 RepID=UPI002A6B4430|nr:uncharacterized protein LOC133144251 [Syngnathus typhle]
MACGIYLGILLLCLLGAEHVRCLWASQEAQGESYVGFVQDDNDGSLSHVGKPPQNQFRQVSRVQALAQSGSSGGVSTYDNQQFLGGYSSLKVVRRPPVATAGESIVLKKPGLSTDIASSGSLSRFKPHQSNVAVGQAEEWKIPNGHQSRGKFPNLQGYGMRKYSANMQTSANAAATKVLIGQKPARHQKKNLKHNHGQMMFQGKRQQLTGGLSEAGPNGQLYAHADVLKIPSQFGGYAIRRLKDPVVQKSSKPIPHHAHLETKWTRVKLRS